MAEPDTPRDVAGRHGASAWPRRLLADLIRSAKPFASSVILPRLPRLEAWLATRWRYSVATRDIAAMSEPTRYWADKIILGTPGDPGMTILPDIRADPFGPIFPKPEHDPEKKGNPI